MSVKRNLRKKTPQNSADFGFYAARLLDWYDRHARVLPWRARGGKQADPYRVWLSEIMLQQTTVVTVKPYYERFLEKWPDVNALARAKVDDVMAAWAGLGYYARARNLHLCAQAIAADHQGHFPDNEEQLLKLPGVGPYTAAAIAAIAFDKPATVVDGNVERVVARLFAVQTPLPEAKAELRALSAKLTPQKRAGDFAQGMMDLGATLCTPRAPACVLCPLTERCVAFQQGRADELPRRLRAKPRPEKRAAVFWLKRSDGAVLLRKRPPKGLLGGMMEVPSSPWLARFDEKEALAHAPLKLRWRRVPGTIRHVFTHFALEFVVYEATETATAMRRGRMAQGADGEWVALKDLSGRALPSLMRKVADHVLGKSAA